MMEDFSSTEGNERSRANIYFSRTICLTCNTSRRMEPQAGVVWDSTTPPHLQLSLPTVLIPWGLLLTTNLLKTHFFFT